MDLIPYRGQFLLDSGEYDPGKVQVLRKINGAKWNPSKKMWTIPRDYLTIKKLSRMMDKRFPDNPIEMDDETLDWLWEEHDRRKNIPPVGRKERVSLKRVPKAAPALFKAADSRPFQTVGIKFCAYNQASLLADEPGLGKTLQSIGAMIEADVRGPILVMAPKTAAIVTWPHEIQKWAPNDMVTLATGPAKQVRKEILADFDDELDQDWNGEGYSHRHWIIVNFEMLRVKYHLDRDKNFIKENNPLTNDKKATVDYPELLDIQWNGVIIDESHKVLVAKSSDPKGFTLVRAGIGLLDIEPENGIKIAMSGTPQRGKNEKLWGTLNWLRPDLYTSYWRWVEDFFVSYKDQYSVTIGEVKDEAKFYKDLSNVMIRRTKAEVTPELPPKQYQDVFLKMLPKQEKAYRQMELEAMVVLEDGEVNALGALAEMTRLKQFASAYGTVSDGTMQAAPPSNKLEWIIEWLEERRDADTKVIIASQFTRLINMFATELEKEKWDCHVLTGATPAGERARMQREFQAGGGPRVFLLNTNAGGVSLTLDAADDVIIVDKTWNPDDQIQVEDRAHRVSRTDHSVTIWNLISEGTIEASIKEINDEREYKYKSLIDGQRGVSFAKQIMKIEKEEDEQRADRAPDERAVDAGSDSSLPSGQESGAQAERD